MEKLVIKFKLDGDSAQNNQLYTCEVCNRKFTCGKAYGGHKRIHSMKRKETQLIEDMDIQQQHNDARPRYTKCSFCPKTFRTDEGFEEHMKTHGQRAGNDHDDTDTEEQSDSGLAGNDHNSSSSSSSASESNASQGAEAKENDGVNSGAGEKPVLNDLTKVLPPGWAKTGRRAYTVEDHVICVPKSADMYQGDGDVKVPSLEEIREGILPPKKKKLESSLPPGEMNNQRSTETDQEGKEKIPAVKDKAGESSNMAATRGTVAYVCHKCGKSFASYHALGGHSAHHKKEESSDFVKGIAKRHRCPNCNKCYVRRGTLLAHRKYCDQGQKPLTQVALEEAKVVVPKRAFSFDLNELPPPESEDEVLSGRDTQEMKGAFHPAA